MLLLTVVVAVPGHVAVQVVLLLAVPAAGKLLVLAVVQVLVVVEGDNRPSPAASDGCPLGMLLLTVVVAAAVQVAVQMAVQVAVPAAELAAVQVAVLEEALLVGSCFLAVLRAGPFFTLAGGGMGWSFAGVCGTLAALTGAPFDPLGPADITASAELVAEVLAWDLDTLARGEGRRGRRREQVNVCQDTFLDTLGQEDGEGLGVEEEVDGCWVGVCLRLCTLGGGVTDTLGEDTGDVCMVVGVVTAREGCVVMGVLVMEGVDEDEVHSGVSGDVTGREVDEEEEGTQWRQWMLACVHGHGACVSACEMKCCAYVCLSHFCVVIWVHASLKVCLG
ncbi:hypothetical protein NDU88_005119 [Pleurodeles waltl]|uniref:Uncharacterized protein n=1 Tax=Pleurodeles waltl TaxID=8319 RepID=A0AAV7WAZ3_PLEWA|nr:hypothetical protein NDU88_005119 [Pleurodeles waltl]